VRARSFTEGIGRGRRSPVCPCRPTPSQGGLPHTPTNLQTTQQNSHGGSQRPGSCPRTNYAKDRCASPQLSCLTTVPLQRVKAGTLHNPPQPSREKREEVGKQGSPTHKTPNADAATDRNRTRTSTQNINLIAQKPDCLLAHAKQRTLRGSSKTMRSRQLPRSPTFPQGALPKRTH
jgi:hypothetical protein